MRDSDPLPELEDIFRKVLGPDVEFAPALSRKQCVRWDSLNHARIMLLIEERFGFRLAVHEMRAASSVTAILTLLSEKRRADA